MIVSSGLKVFGGGATGGEFSNDLIDDVFLASFYLQPSGKGGQGVSAAARIPQLCFAASGDGINFSNIAANITPFNFLATPSMQDFTFLEVDGIWYYTGTPSQADPGQQYIRVYASDSLQINSFVEVAVIDIKSIRPTAVRQWAPEFFVDNDDEIYIITTMGDGPNPESPGNPFRPYAFRALSRDLTSWEPTGKLTRTGIRSGAGSWDDESTIDTCVCYHGGKYHAMSKDNPSLFIQHWEADSLLGPWIIENDGAADSLGWGGNTEGPNLVKLSNGRWRCYMDHADDGQPWYADSSDLRTWDPRQRAYIPGSARHLCVNKYNKRNYLDTVFRLSLSSRAISTHGTSFYSRVFKNAVQNLAQNIWVEITNWNSEFDPEGNVDLNDQSSILTVPRSGIYRVEGSVGFNPGASQIGVYEIDIRVYKDTTINASNQELTGNNIKTVRGDGNGLVVELSKTIFLYQGHRIELWARADRGATSVPIKTDGSTYLHLIEA